MDSMREQLCRELIDTIFKEASALFPNTTLRRDAVVGNLDLIIHELHARRGGSLSHLDAPSDGEVREWCVVAPDGTPPTNWLGFTNARRLAASHARRLGKSVRLEKLRHT